MENFTEFLDKRKRIAKTGEMISKISEGKFSICLGYVPILRHATNIAIYITGEPKVIFETAE